jgi:tetratricopeptide (TPR) repeat protein
MQILRKLLWATLIAAFFSACSSENKKLHLLDRARRDFDAGKYDDARIGYLSVLQMEPRNEIAMQQLGTIWFDDGAPIQALFFLQKTKELAPNELGCRARLAKVMMMLGEPSSARKEAVAVLDLDPSNDDCIILLADTARGPKEVEETVKRLHDYEGSKRPSVYLALASLSIRKGDLAAAEGALEHAIALDPQSASAHLAKADLLLLKRESAQASEELKTAARFAPVRSSVRLRYAEFKAKAGDSSEAVATLKEITRQAPDYLPAWGALAKIAYEGKRYDESLALLENIFNRDQSNLEGHLLRCYALLGKGEAKSALDELNRLDTLYPGSPIIKYAHARAHLQTNALKEAVGELNQALTLRPDYPEAILLLGETELRAGDPQPVPVLMRRLLSDHPNLIQARLLLADAYTSLGQLDDAARIFREQITMSPRIVQPYLGLGLVLRRQGKNSEARNAFQKAQDLEPQNLTPVEQLVDLDILDKDFNSAIRRVRELSQENSGLAPTAFLEAKINFAQGNWDQAETSLLKALQADPAYSKAYDLLIYVYVAANKLPEASEKVNNLLSKQPDDLPLLMLLGMIYDKMNEFTKAKETYEKLLSLQPNFEAALNNLAWLYAEKLHQLDKAYDLARKARALEPGAAPTADTLGWILYKRQDYAQALECFKESAAKLTGSPEAQFHLGMAFYMMGQVDPARTALRRAVEAASDFPGKQDAVTRLALLGASSGDPMTPPMEKIESFLKQEPDDVFARLLLGDAYQKQGKFGDAAQAYEAAIKINRQLLPAFTRLQKLYAGPLDNAEKAAELETKIKTLSPAGSRGGSPLPVGNL